MPNNNSRNKPNRRTFDRGSNIPSQKNVPAMPQVKPPAQSSQKPQK